MPDVSNKALLGEVATYYTEKLRLHGDTPQGVDWNGVESQTRRFTELSRIFTSVRGFSVNDLGCGYGAFYDYLVDHHDDVRYLGIDVSEDMVKAATQRVTANPNVRFLCGDAPDLTGDFGVASGIFNVRLGRSDAEWKNHLHASLDILNRTSSKGFAFNCLTSYSDAEKMQSHLYYADPGEVFDHCKRTYSRHVALLHDYGLYEFTVLVRKQA